MLILSPQDVVLSRIRHPETQQKMVLLTYQNRHFGLIRKFEASDRQGALEFYRNLVDKQHKTCVLLEDRSRYSVWGKLKSLGGKSRPVKGFKPNYDGTLFTEQEWAKLTSLSEEEFGQALLKKLNQQRKLLGSIALSIVHNHPSVQYRRTSTVFLAYRDGGGLTYGFVIRWFRDLALGVGKNLTTKMTWEVVDRQHLRAEVAEDESVFSPGNGKALDRFFATLLPH